LSDASLAIAFAFLVGALTTYFDCYSTLASRIGRVPGTFGSNPLVIGLAVLCGALAAGACWLSGRDRSGVINTVLSLQAPDPWRGVVVGASVLVLIRSKLFNVQDSPFGGDYLYQLGRETAIQDVNVKWTKVRTRFQNDHISLALRDPQFEAKVVPLITANIRARPAAFQSRVSAEVSAVMGNRPTTIFSPTDPAWDIYYRALIGVALDASGPAALAALEGFAAD